jgi:hypothetical protein
MLKEQTSVTCGFEVGGGESGGLNDTPYALNISNVAGCFNGKVGRFVGKIYGAEENIIITRGYSGIWRRGRDSNPRYGHPHTPLAGERLQPLGHLSTCVYARFVRLVQV